eukprot:365105-Chlamydomonas_euryale.AAC.13
MGGLDGHCTLRRLLVGRLTLKVHATHAAMSLPYVQPLLAVFLNFAGARAAIRPPQFTCASTRPHTEHTHTHAHSHKAITWPHLAPFP